MCCRLDFVFKQLIGIREGLGVLLGSRELLFVKWVLFRVHNCCFCIKKLLRSMSSSENVLLVVRC